MVFIEWIASFSHDPNLLPYEANTPVGAATTSMECAGYLVETVGTSEAWADCMKRYFDTLIAGEAKPVHEEEV
jgi:hypothetical protein